jgi:hypothetical protein
MSPFTAFAKFVLSCVLQSATPTAIWSWALRAPAVARPLDSASRSDQYLVTGRRSRAGSGRRHYTAPGTDASPHVARAYSRGPPEAGVIKASKTRRCREAASWAALGGCRPPVALIKAPPPQLQRACRPRSPGRPRDDGREQAFLSGGQAFDRSATFQQVR